MAHRATSTPSLNHALNRKWGKKRIRYSTTSVWHINYQKTTREWCARNVTAGRLNRSWENRRKSTKISIHIVIKEAPNTEHKNVIIKQFPNHTHMLNNYTSIRRPSLEVRGYLEAVTTRSWCQLPVIKFPRSKLRWKTYKSPRRTCGPLWRPGRNKKRDKTNGRPDVK